MAVELIEFVNDILHEMLNLGFEYECLKIPIFKEFGINYWEFSHYKLQ